MAADQRRAGSGNRARAGSDPAAGSIEEQVTVPPRRPVKLTRRQGAAESAHPCRRVPICFSALGPRAQNTGAVDRRTSDLQPSPANWTLSPPCTERPRAPVVAGDRDPPVDRCGWRPPAARRSGQHVCVRRGLAGVVVVLIAACVRGEEPAAKPEAHDTSATTQPVLGRPFAPGQTGFGEAHPVVIFAGGDPTGLVEDVEWRSWGAERAVGVGYSWVPPADGPVAAATRERVTVVAWDLGACAGQPAYRALAWQVDLDPRKLPDSYMNSCTGDPVPARRPHRS